MDELAQALEQQPLVFEFNNPANRQTSRPIIRKTSSNIDTILYEHPLHEHVRVCLRLEMLFNKAQQLLHGTSTWDTHHCLATIIELINVLDRPDLKAKLTQEFKRYLNHLNRLNSAAAVDQSKLKLVIDELETLVENFHQAHGKLAQDLRDNDFITHVRQHLLSPGGTCSFDTPGYHFWLQQPREVQERDLSNWLNSLDQIHSAVTQLLRLTRESGSTHLMTAYQGFYQTALDLPCKLIQVRLPAKLSVFPEISAGRHRLCVRFLIPTFSKPTQYKEDITFELTYCTL